MIASAMAKKSDKAAQEARARELREEIKHPDKDPADMSPREFTDLAARKAWLKAHPPKSRKR